MVVAAGGGGGAAVEGGTPHATVPPRFGLMLVGAMAFKLASGDVIVLG